ncbi:DUF3078 domain-containing protein [Aureibaculum sp. A20]|uniref:DUF3078 domain-containing protein n=1 Tax=Aureibaculum flavum TaxID=2795986 RepID=A0ABS0WQ19_9FLAO|nr:DUF3078 domain-containing protein [Aureibaculum flavum]MBJ2174070.1 DUF3078 domain-containing protein [Aureibaculum flavum]
MRKIVLTLVVMLAITSTYAQTREELKAEQSAKKDSVTAIQGRVDAIQGQIDALPGWKKGAFGTIGGNISGFNDWYSKSAPNSSTGSVGITFNGYANLMQEKFFWRNSLGVNLAWIKNDNTDDPTDSDNFDAANDVFTLTSLYGRKLNSKWAISGLAEYRTALLEGNFNDPGYLDLGVGATWTPITELVVVIHPLNYNFVFSKGATSYESSLGAKVVADYTKKIAGVNFKSNLSAFLSYSETDYSNWTWTNSIGYTFWKGIGVGAELGLRKNKQEAFNSADNTSLTLAGADSVLQSYWLVGLNYAF